MIEILGFYLLIAIVLRFTLPPLFSFLFWCCDVAQGR